MNAAELVDRLRTDLDDLADPWLWSSAELYSYVDSAQKTFCRLTEGIPDVLDLPLVVDELGVGQEWYVRDPRILKIRGVRRLNANNTSIGRSVAVMSHSQFRNGWDYFDSRSGPTQVLIDSEKKGYLRAYPVPSVADPLELTVTDGSEAELEIDEMHHIYLLDGAKALAYLKQDAETQDKTAANDARQRFEAYCTRCKGEQSRIEFGVGTVAYGGL
jgi:hypothetical protein